MVSFGNRFLAVKKVWSFPYNIIGWCIRDKKNKPESIEGVNYENKKMVTTVVNSIKLKDLFFKKL
jgi:hypothetical protein